MNNNLGRPVLERVGVSRRTFLRGSALGATGLATAALIGCGGDDNKGTPAGTQATSGAAGQQKTGNVLPVPGDRAIAAGLPYPFNFVEPDKPKKKGGTARWLYTFDPGQLDPTKTAAGGTETAVNLVYDRLIGIYGGPDADPSSQTASSPASPNPGRRRPTRSRIRSSYSTA